MGTDSLLVTYGHSLTMLMLLHVNTDLCLRSMKCSSVVCCLQQEALPEHLHYPPLQPRC